MFIVGSWLIGLTFENCLKLALKALGEYEWQHSGVNFIFKYMSNISLCCYFYFPERLYGIRIVSLTQIQSMDYMTQ